MTGSKGGKEKEKEKGGEGGDAGAPFSAGEKVLAYHGPLIYHAKVQKAELRSEGWKFFLHYSGWSKSWDEWVGPERLLKETAANLAKKEKLSQDAIAEKKKNKAGATTPLKEKEKTKGTPTSDLKKHDETTPVSGGKGKKRKAESSPEPREEKESGTEGHVKIPLPASLKKQLVNDWRIITQDEQLVKLPRSPTVAEVLQRYLDAKARKEGKEGKEGNKEAQDATNTLEVASGLRAYFDRALPAILLYRQERAQYAQALPEGSLRTPSEVYGAEHLLRLFIKLPELLGYIQMEEETLALLVSKLAEFLKFLQKHQSQLFLQQYDGPRVEEGGKESSSQDTRKPKSKEELKAAGKNDTPGDVQGGAEDDDTNEETNDEVKEELKEETEEVKEEEEKEVEKEEEEKMEVNEEEEKGEEETGKDEVKDEAMENRKEAEEEEGGASAEKTEES